MKCCITNEPQIYSTCFTNVPFVRDCGDEEELWRADDDVMNPSGTFIITLTSSCGGAQDADLIVNGEDTGIDLEIGETRAFTFDPLESIAVECSGSGEDGCQVTLSLMLNYERNLL